MLEDCSDIKGLPLPFNTEQLTQLLIEYDPQPPFNAGSPDKAPAMIVNEAREAFAKLQATAQ